MKKQMSLAQKVNVLRASVMGANDGIISVAGIVIGVAAATDNTYAILIAGLAGTLAGMISMCMGEYVSVSTQKDSQQEAIKTEKERLDANFNAEYAFVRQQYLDQGIAPELAEEAASELMANDPLNVVVEERYGFNPREFTSPYAAAVASFISFPLGATLPMVAVTMTPPAYRILVTMLAVLVALVITGYCAAVLGKNPKKGLAILRNVAAGILTMGVTYVIGQLLHA